MSDLICDNYPLVLVLNRFGIELGFGESAIGEVCRTNGVDTDTFLAVVNMLISQDKTNIDYSKISVTALVEYLHNSHSYYLEYRLPAIRQNLLEAIGGDVATAIVNYFDEYVSEVRNHMMHEESTLFPYIKSVVSGSGDKDYYSIDFYSEHHDKIEAKLSELKGILIKYCPATTTNKLCSVLYDVFSCERDLASHNDIEDYILVPAMKELER